MKKIRWGVLSTARIAQNQLIPAIQSADNAELIAVASRVEDKAKNFAKTNHIPKAYGSYEELLQDPNIDAVYIPLPNSLHAEWTIKAAQHGKHVLCEKPAALTAEQTIRMITACEENGVVFAEAFMYQYHPQWQRVFELIEEGTVGEVRVVNASFSFPLANQSDIRLGSTTGGGSLYDIGCYCVHIIRTLAKNEHPNDVKATAVFTEDGLVDRSLTAVLRFPNGLLAHLDSSFEVADRQYVEIAGTNGTITVPYAFRPDKGTPSIIIRTKSGVQTVTVENDPTYKLQVEDFGNCIETGKQSKNKLEHSIGNMEIIDAIYKAAGRKSL